MVELYVLKILNLLNFSGRYNAPPPPPPNPPPPHLSPPKEPHPDIENYDSKSLKSSPLMMIATPFGEPSDVDSKYDILVTQRKRNAQAQSNTSYHPKRRKTIDMDELAKEWGVSVAEARMITAKYNAAY
ncbi:hypothetical protein LXL04_020702 [Taraxacum kok-saghyz]